MYGPPVRKVGREETDKTMLHRKHVDAKGNWTGYRPDIRILDCTIRDGGLVNNHKFDEAFVRAVYETCVAAGVDYCELGYKGARRLFAAGQHGEWKFCDEETIRRVVGDGPRSIKLSVMADVDRTDYHTDILPKAKSVIDCVRVACYVHQIPGALDMIKDAHDKGYETTLNLMAISKVQDREIEETLAVVAESPVDTMYVVDSNGALYSEQVHDIVMGFLEAPQGHRQAHRHPRAQQHAARLRQHHRGAHRRRRSPGRHHRRASAAAPATVRSSSCSPSSRIRSSTCVRSSSASRSTSCRCVSRWTGATAFPT